MLSIQSSVSKEALQKAKDNFVNHVYSRMHCKLTKTLKVSEKPSLGIKTEIYKLYGDSDIFDFDKIKSKYSISCSDKIIDEFLSFVKDNLYNLITGKIEVLLDLQSDFDEKTFMKRIKAYDRLHKTLSDHLKIYDKNRKKFNLNTKSVKTEKDRIKSKIKKLTAKHETFKTFVYSIVNQVFNYSGIVSGYKKSNKIEYSLYDLGKNLNLRTCPYCNKNYIFTIEDNSNKSGSGKLVNATFDHWFPQSKYPLLQLSFYNLIPSCSNCNSSIKNDDDFSIKTHIHPYTVEQDITTKYKFNYFYDIEGEPLVYIDYLGDEKLNKKLRRTFSDFKTEKIYAAQLTELKDMIELVAEYGEDYIETIEKSYPESKLSKERVYNLLFNTSEQDENHHKRSLSKFRYDVLKKLLIIK